MSLSDKKSSEDKKFLRETRLNQETRRPRPKRTIIPENIKVVKSPELNDLVNDALSIIGAELSYYSKRARTGVILDPKEARKVRDYMECLVKMSKEAREAQKPEALEHLTDEQLLHIVNTEDAENIKKQKSEK